MAGIRKPISCLRDAEISLKLTSEHCSVIKAGIKDCHSV